MVFITDTVKKRKNGQRSVLQKSFILLLVVAILIIAVLAGVIIWQHLQKTESERVCVWQ